MLDDFIYAYVMKDLTLCDKLIEYYKNDDKYKRRGITAGYGQNKVSTDVTIGANIVHPVPVAYMKELCAVGLQNYTERYPHFSPMGIKEPWNIQHYKPKEGYFNWHCERSSYMSDQRALVFMTYLNDVNDGGETEFYYQKRKIKPVKGKTIIWPTDFTHLHRGVTSPTEHKIIATGWFNYFDVIDMDRYYNDIGLFPPKN